MPVVIERIIRIERAESDAFIKKQKKRLAQLKAMEKRQKEGKRVRTGRIVKELQEAGILDEHGNLAYPYSESI